MAERVKEQEFETGFLHGWDGSGCIYYTDEKCLYYNDAVVITQYDTQINTNTLQQDGFTEVATAEKLFYADRQTKTLEFVGRM